MDQDFLTHILDKYVSNQTSGDKGLTINLGGTATNNLNFLNSIIGGNAGAHKGLIVNINANSTNNQNFQTGAGPDSDLSAPEAPSILPTNQGEEEPEYPESIIPMKYLPTRKRKPTEKPKINTDYLNVDNDALSMFNEIVQNVTVKNSN